MKEEKEARDGFFSRMRHSKNPGFEITMFSISIAVALAVLVGVIMVAWYYFKGQAAHYTDEEVNAGSVTQAAVEVDVEDSEPVETIDPNSDAIINEDNIFDADEALKDAEFAYTTSDVNLRSDPSLTGSEVLLKIVMGEKVGMVEYDGGEWALVSYNGQEGYINALYLSVSKPIQYAPVVEETVTATEEPTKKPVKTPKPIKTPKPQKTEEPDIPVETEEPEVTETPVETEVPTETEVPVEPTPEPVQTEAPPVQTEQPTPAPEVPTEAPPAE
ncbi:MAG: SH3 domain-containing protein [Eubacterium sp.]|nr:SH3 domain-containing protein [Eubacterium sp.]